MTGCLGMTWQCVNGWCCWDMMTWQDVIGSPVCVDTWRTRMTGVRMTLCTALVDVSPSARWMTGTACRGKGFFGTEVGTGRDTGTGTG